MGMSVNNSLKFLAEGLAENNYDVFTYDKRVVYLLKNNKEIPSMDFQHGIDDAATIIDYLKNDLGYKNIVVDRKSTRLNSSHVRISYAVFCLKKKKKKKKK